jgi:hypothetical protein
MTRLVASLLAIAAAGAAYGAPFGDPTRPPSVFDGDAPAGLPAGPRLESVLIAPDRRVAVISGEEVTIGSRFRDGEVVRITEGEVLIRRPGGDELLKLFVGDGKRPAGANGR